MTVTTTTHLNFRREARQALEFHRSVVDGRLDTATYADFGAPTTGPDADAVVWGQVSAPSGFRVMAYDVPTEGRSTGPAGSGEPTTRRVHGTTRTSERFFPSLRGDSVEEVTALWDALARGATVVEPFAPAARVPASGMLADRFGVTWVIDVTPPHQPA